MKVNILGRLYEVREATTETDPALKENDGYCDPSVAVCVVDKQGYTKGRKCRIV